MASTEPRFRIIELVLVKPGTGGGQFAVLSDEERCAIPKGQPLMVLGKLSAQATLATPATQLKVLLRKDDAVLTPLTTGGLTASPGPLSLTGSTSTYDFLITINPPVPPPPPQIPPLPPQFVATPFFLQVFYFFPAETAASPVPLSTESVTGKFV